jgi:hypothetical protein
MTIIIIIIIIIIISLPLLNMLPKFLLAILNSLSL